MEYTEEEIKAMYEYDKMLYGDAVLDFYEKMFEKMFEKNKNILKTR